jgi:hypothetical protein
MLKKLALFFFITLVFCINLGFAQNILSEIDLVKIGKIAPKGRVQDKNYNQLSIIDKLIGNGKDSIPFLIENLDNETKFEEPILDYWKEVKIGDVALVILTNFFTDKAWKNTTIPDVSWDIFLKRGKNKSFTGEQVLRNYIKKYGRKNIKQRWQKIFEQNKNNIFWDETENCFNLKK